MKKQYNFDEAIERHGTDCVKYDALTHFYGREDLLPMWVADMDFRSPDFVLDAIKERCNHEVLGYGIAPESYQKSVLDWLESHYGICASSKEIHFIPGIVAGIAYALLSLTMPGDKILVTTPVYPPFLNLPKACQREVVCSPLKIEEGRFVIDFDNFERLAGDCKMLILSNPHNPAGTVWGKEVLTRVADICHKYGVIVISDEIHADLTLPGHNHVSYSTVCQNAKTNSLTFMAPSKTFNIAGLGSSTCYIADPVLRDRFFGWLDAMGVAGGNIFAFVGAEAAFANGEEWRLQMLDYLQSNVDCLRDFLAQRLPRVQAVLPEASYLAWLDLSAYGRSHKELADLLVNKARLALNDGTTFGGTDYEGWFRMNIGCPRSMLLEALDRMAAALER